MLIFNTAPLQIISITKNHSLLTFTTVSPLTHETEGFGFPIVVHGRTAFNPSIISTFIGGRVILGPKILKTKN